MVGRVFSHISGFFQKEWKQEYSELRSWLPVRNSPYGPCGRKSTLNWQQLHWPTLEKQRKQAHLTTYKFHHSLIHMESKYCPSKSKHHRRTTWHTHNLTYDIPSHWTAYRQMTFFPRIIPEWNSLPQEVTTAPPWLLRDQGRLPTRSLTSINKKWISQGWSCACRGSSTGTTTVARLV